MSIDFIGMHKMVPGDRLFSPINDLLIILAGVSHAASLIVESTIHIDANPSMRVSTRQYDYAFVLPLRGPLEQALNSTVPEFIEIGMTKDLEPLKSFKLTTKGLDRPLSNLISPIFIMFFERYNEWLNDTFGRDSTDKWHPTLNFARVVRNAAAHGSIYFRNPNALPVSWRNLTFGPKDNGRKIIGDDLRIGDILGLMFETNAELDAIGATIL